MRLSFIFRRVAVSLAATLLLSPSWAQSPAPIKLALIEGLSGPFGNTGEAVVRNIAWAVERVNARGGVKLPGGNRPLVIERFDSKDQTDEALYANFTRATGIRINRIEAGDEALLERLRTEGRGRRLG